MFYNRQSKKEQEKYKNALTMIGNLSKLFSNSSTPYLYYRVAEKIFCDMFDAQDLSRGDIALDASKNNIGIGLKTFLKNNNNTLQKIAEFNKDRMSYQGKKPQEIIKIISYLRNERIHFANNLSGAKNSYYHCVARDKERFYIYEEPMDEIDVKNITEVIHKKMPLNFMIINMSIHLIYQKVLFLKDL